MKELSIAMAGTIFQAKYVTIGTIKIQENFPRKINIEY